MTPSEGTVRTVFDAVSFDDRGLIVAIARAVDDGAILMTAFMDESALRRTLETGIVHYWSRSRSAIWRKGATSGHEQHLREIRIDCDGDAILLDVEAGPACHTGHRTCFFRRLEGGEFVTDDEPVFDPEDVYG